MNKTTLFHPGELYFQNKRAVAGQIAEIAPHLILEYLPKQHQDFYSQLTIIFIASVDQCGKPWASVITGPVGFITIIDETHFKIDTTILCGDPLINNLQVGQTFGFLGLLFASRRRNRISARLIKKYHNTLFFKVKYAFGNCPKYIQTRDIKCFVINNNNSSNTIVKPVLFFDSKMRRLISKSDTFFISSYYDKKENRGGDISHRGGKPGFVEVIDDKTLSFDDYEGNNLFMTLGNLKCNAVAGILFIDFDSGDMLQLTCYAEVLEFPQHEFQHKIRLTLEKGYYFNSALLIDCEFLAYSPFLR